MPEPYIIYRNQYKDAAHDWNEKYGSLSTGEKEEFKKIIGENYFGKEILKISNNKRVRRILEHYL